MTLIFMSNHSKARLELPGKPTKPPGIQARAPRALEPRKPPRKRVYKPEEEARSPRLVPWQQATIVGGMLVLSALVFLAWPRADEPSSPKPIVAAKAIEAANLHSILSISNRYAEIEKVAADGNAGELASSLVALNSSLPEEMLFPTAMAYWKISADSVPALRELLREHALKHFRAAADFAPTNPVIPAQMGHFFLSENDYASALDELNRAVELGGESHEVLAHTIYALTAMGQPHEAIRRAKDYLLRVPGDMDIRAALASMHAKVGELHEAMDELKLLVQFDPSNPEYPGALFQQAVATGRMQEVISLCSTLIEQKSVNREILYTLAAARMHTEQWKEAEVIFNQLIPMVDTTVPQLRIYRELQARCAFEAGAYETSAELYGKLLQDYPESETAGEYREALALAKKKTN